MYTCNFGYKNTNRFVVYLVLHVDILCVEASGHLIGPSVNCGLCVSFEVCPLCCKGQVLRVLDATYSHVLFYYTFR